MTDHLPECHMSETCHAPGPHQLTDGLSCWKCMRECICDRLRACEQREREEERFRCLTMSENRSRWREEGVNAGYAAGLEAAWKAIKKQALYLDPECEYRAVSAIAALRGEHGASTY